MKTPVLPPSILRARLAEYLLPFAALVLLAACQGGSLTGVDAPEAGQASTGAEAAGPAASVASPAPAQSGNAISASANGSTSDPVVVTDTWLTAPTYAETFNSNGNPPNIDFVGLSRQAAATASLQVSDLTQATATWTTIATSTTAATATTTKQEQLYSFSFKNVAINRADWAQGGVVRVRVLVGTSASVSFDARSAACQALTNNPTWTEFAKNCGSNRPFVTLVATSGTFPQGDVNFLLPPDGNTKVVDNENDRETNAYLQATGLRTRAATLSAFQALYNLGGPGAGAGKGDINAIYYNFGDLGFGREMHCNRASNGDIGCAVTNYGTPGGDANQALTLALGGTNPVATVAMEYRANAATDKVTFMVYDGQGNPLTQATLDSQGNKSTPLICISCHGGTYDETTHSITGTNFLPFDTDELLYSNRKGFTLADQQEKFRQLNALVASTMPSSSIASTIAGWYGNLGVDTAGAKLDPTYVPAGWQDQTDLYTNVVKPYCRSCHNSLTGSLSWPTSADFLALSASIERDVCTAAVMPRSEQTAKHFFQSGARAGLLDALHLQSSCNPK